MRILDNLGPVWPESASRDRGCSQWIGVVSGFQQDLLVGSWSFISLTTPSYTGQRLSVRRSLFLRHDSTVVARGAP